MEIGADHVVRIVEGSLDDLYSFWLRLKRRLLNRKSMKLSAVKQISISLGLYKFARAVHRALFRSERNKFATHKNLLSQFIKSGDLAFDVGANIGVRTEIMLSIGATVVAFEPQPICAREIRARGNRHLTVVEKAVGAVEGSADLHLKSETGQASLLPNWQGGPPVGVLTVPVTTLDAEIKKYGRPVFCKIDVEGFEAEVLRGLSSPIKALSFEYHCDEAGVAKVRDCLTLLSKLANYDVNLIGQEGDEWLLPRWIPANEFLDNFRACASPHFWGDIFVKC